MKFFYGASFISPTITYASIFVTIMAMYYTRQLCYIHAKKRMRVCCKKLSTCVLLMVTQIYELLLLKVMNSRKRRLGIGMANEGFFQRAAPTRHRWWCDDSQVDCKFCFLGVFVRLWSRVGGCVGVKAADSAADILTGVVCLSFIWAVTLWILVAQVS